MQWLKSEDTTNVKRSNKLQFEGQTIKCQNEKTKQKCSHKHTTQKTKD